MRKRLPAGKRAEIVAALKANPNASQVARRFGDVDVVTVCKIAKAEGITLPAKGGRPRWLTAETRAKIVAALEATPNASQVARQIGGVSSSTVWKIAKAEDIALVIRKRYYRRDDTCG